MARPYNRTKPIEPQPANLIPLQKALEILECSNETFRVKFRNTNRIFPAKKYMNKYLYDTNDVIRLRNDLTQNVI